MRTEFVVPVAKRIVGVALGMTLYFSASAGYGVTPEFSTYLGGTGSETGTVVRLRSNGECCVLGYTQSNDYPTTECYQCGRAGNNDVCLSVLSSDGSQLLHSGYLGGSRDDYGYDLALDGEGSFHLIGTTSSLDFPTVNPVQGTLGGGTDVFMCKLSSDGASLPFASYLGGKMDEEGFGLCLGSGGETYVAGFTESTDFPTATAFQPTYGGGPRDAFLAGFSSGAVLLFSSYLGGSDQDDARSIGVDSSGRIYLTGSTTSVNFPTRDAYQGVTDGLYPDVFLSVFVPDGSSLVYSTYLGGDTGYPPWANPVDEAHSLAVSPGGEAYITGLTWSLDFPTLNPYQPGKGASTNFDSFLSKFDSVGSLAYSTYLGGNDRDIGYAVSVDSLGNALVAGRTYSFNFPTKAAWQPRHAGSAYSYDAFVTGFASIGSQLLFSSFLGGSGTDIGYGIAADDRGFVVITGSTNSVNFPTYLPFQANQAGGNDIILVKLRYVEPTPSPTPSPTPTPTPSPTPSFTPTPSPTPTASPTPSPTPTTTPTSTPSPTSSPTPTASVTPSPTPTVIRCLEVSGRVSSASTAQPPPWVRVVFADRAGRAVAADSEGFFRAEGCTHLPSGVLRLEARRRGFFPALVAADYVDWADVTGVEVSLSPLPASVGPRHSDYDGDGTADVAFFRPDNFLWNVRGVTRFYFGRSEDVPVPADYDGDGTTEAAVHRGWLKLWVLRGITREYFGDFMDLPAVGDWNGDGTDEPGVFRPEQGLWRSKNSTRFYFGRAGDFPLVVEGEGALLAGIYREDTRFWRILGLTSFYFGLSGDVPLGVRFPGSGGWLPTFFRDATGLWKIRGLTTLYLGGSGDIPVPAAFRGRAEEDVPAVFQPVLGHWILRGVTSFYLGREGDIPVSR